MELLSFVKTCSSNPAFLTDNVVICFRGTKEYPILFFSHVIAWARRQGFLVHVVDLEDDNNDDSVRANLQTSFLGTHGIYWLRNLSSLSEKRRKSWGSYIKSYAGPHTIAFFATDDVCIANHEHALSVEVPDTISQNNFSILLSLESSLSQQVRSACKRLLAACPEKMSLDELYVMLGYAILLGERQQEFTEQWLDKIVINEQSLFTLSQYFFARNSRRFFSYWRTVGSEYPEVFWVAYWSDQLWRAFLYCSLMKERRLADAKRSSFRLPFSFLNTDWRLWKAQDLIAAHDKLYDIDGAIKNGGSASFELFYSVYLTKVS